MSPELLSDLSVSSLSSVPGRMGPEAPEGPQAPEVAPHLTPLTPLDSGATRFLKRPSAAALDPSKERAVSCSVLTSLTSQSAALSRLAQIEHRFGKSPFRAEQRNVQNLTEGQAMLPSPTRPSPTRPSPTRPSPTRPSSARPGTEPRHFVKSRPQAALVGDTGGHSGPSEDSAQESNSRHSVTCPAPRSRELHHCPVSPQDTSPAQPQSSLSPSCLSSCPPCVSPSPLSLSSSVGSACGDVRSLEELFPLEESNSDRSDTGHFRMNLVDLEDLGPAALVLKEEEVPEEVPEEEPEEVPEEELEEEVPEEELEEEVPEEELQEEIEEVEYPTDFESPSEGPSQDSGQPPSPRSQSSYSNTFSRATISDPSSPEATSQPNSPLPQPDALLAKASKDPAGQTFHLPAAHGGPCPSMGLLVESLRQQLALTSHFINSSQEHHTQALGGLGPPNYRYTTLEDTLKSISTLRASRPRSDQKTQRR